MTNAEDSIKNLWKSLPATTTRYTETQMQARAQKMDAKAKRQHLMDYIAYALLFGLIAYIHLINEERFNWVITGLMVFGTAIASWNYHSFVRKKTNISETSNAGLLQFLRAELTRQRDYAASFWRGYILPFVPAIVFLFTLRWSQYGETLIALNHDRMTLVFMTGFIAAFLSACMFWNWLKAANCQRQLNELDGA
jgi:Flp pilus assembly protein TadB